MKLRNFGLAAAAGLLAAALGGSALAASHFDVRGALDHTPDSAAWALMITGFAGAGALLRSRRTAPA
jgi:hypothetical protein